MGMKNHPAPPGTPADGINLSCVNTNVPLLHNDDLHWSIGLQMPPGNYGAMREARPWVDNGDGTYSSDTSLDPVAGGPPTKFHPFDLYLMGLASKSEITGNYLLLTNIRPATEATKENPEIINPGLVRADAQRVTIDDIVRIAGEPRSPDAAHSQKEFKIAFVILTKSGQQVPQDLVDNITTAANAFPAQWAYATGYRSTVNERNIVQPSPSPTASPPEGSYRVSFDSNFSTLIDTGDGGVFGNGNEKTINLTLVGGSGQKSVYIQFFGNGGWVPEIPVVASISLILPVPTQIVPQPSTPGQNVVCTQDVQSCPDGSFVGRVPPSCNFAPCPVEIKQPKAQPVSSIPDVPDLRGTCEPGLEAQLNQIRNQMVSGQVDDWYKLQWELNNTGTCSIKGAMATNSLQTWIYYNKTRKPVGSGPYPGPEYPGPGN